MEVEIALHTQANCSDFGVGIGITHGSLRSACDAQVLSSITWFETSSSVEEHFLLDRGSKIAARMGLQSLFAALCTASSLTFFILMYSASREKFTTWKVGWAPSPCDPNAVAAQGVSAFAMHIFFMALAFGVCAPVASVMFILVRDTLGWSPAAAKVAHGTFQLMAFLLSILGFVQIYYAHGSSCKAQGAGGENKHFESVHSYVGILVLAFFWWQLPSALCVFTNNTVLPKGTKGRMTFLKYHSFVGTFAVFAGLATLITGILALVGKNNSMAGATDATWYMFARAAMAALVTIFFLALALFESKSSTKSDWKTQTTPEDPRLLHNNAEMAE